MRSKRITKIELEQAAAYEESMAAEYEDRATNPACNGAHYLRAAAKCREDARSLRVMASEKARRR